MSLRDALAAMVETLDADPAIRLMLTPRQLRVYDAVMRVLLRAAQMVYARRRG